ncbi:MAG: acyl carrier protein [Alphaproteobacteria bacterium]|nr:acyl carrier protein [Alphaproteobacteria bacterium]
MDVMMNADRVAVESLILGQASKILKCDAVGPQDHFLDLGGDSLTAPVFAGRIEAAFGFRPELEDIFTRPFGELAELVVTEISRP